MRVGGTRVFSWLILGGGGGGRDGVGGEGGGNEIIDWFAIFVEFVTFNPDV